jgi:polyketide biosynthesis acyl carrier protein
MEARKNLVVSLPIHGLKPKGGADLNKQDVFNIVVRHCYEVLPELEDHQFKPEERLVDLGANSIDRAEIVTLSLESLSLHMPRVELAGVGTIGELANVLYRNLPPT